MDKNLSWLTEEQFSQLEQLLPRDTRGIARVGDRQVINGIVHLLKSGCGWRGAPAASGRLRTLYNRCISWLHKDSWENIFHAPSSADGTSSQVLIDLASARDVSLCLWRKKEVGGRRLVPRMAVAPRKSRH